MKVYTVTLEYIVTRQVEIISPDEMSHEEASQEARRADLEVRADTPPRLCAIRELLRKASCIVRNVQTEDLPQR